MTAPTREVPHGDYRFLPGIAPYSSGVVATPGHQIVHATLHEEPVSLMLTDSEGLVLNRLSREAGLLRALDDVHLAPCFAFSV